MINLLTFKSVSEFLDEVHLFKLSQDTYLYMMLLKTSKRFCKTQYVQLMLEARYNSRLVVSNQESKQNLNVETRSYRESLGNFWTHVVCKNKTGVSPHSLWQIKEDEEQVKPRVDSKGEVNTDPRSKEMYPLKIRCRHFLQNVSWCIFTDDARLHNMGTFRWKNFWRKMSSLSVTICNNLKF